MKKNVLTTEVIDGNTALLTPRLDLPVEVVEEFSHGYFSIQKIK